MTTEQIRIAMAELDGWTHETKEGRSPGYALTYWKGPDGKDYGIHPTISDFANDFNAVYRVVNALLEHLRYRFLVTLDEITKNGFDWFPKRIVESTPHQWCEAVLRAADKWKETE